MPSDETSSTATGGMVDSMGATLVTGATGNVGRVVAELLRARGHQPLLAVRPGTRHPPAGSVVFDFTDPSTFSFGGFDRVFLMRPPQISNIQRDMLPALEWFRQKQVRQVVLLSVLGAERAPWIPHRKMELAIERLGLPHTFVRPSFFMQNFSGIHAQAIRDANELFVPAGGIRMSFIDAHDIANVCCALLEQPEKHHGKAYRLTGPQALDYNTVARTFSEILGRKITYTRPSLVRFAWRMYREGFAAQYIAVMCMLYAVSRLRPPDTVYPDVEELTGQSPNTLAAFIRRKASTWRPVTA